MSPVSGRGLHHVTAVATDPTRNLAFYRDVLGLSVGPRPGFDSEGYWLYAGGHAIVHLNALLPQTPPEHGPVDHVALMAHGLDATRKQLREAHIPFAETPLKGTTLYQVFLQDPLGLRVELNFDLSVEGDSAGTA